MTRSFARAFSIFFFTSLAFALPLPLVPLPTFSPSYYYISHRIMIHTWPFVFARLLVKNELRARARESDKRASE